MSFDGSSADGRRVIIASSDTHVGPLLEQLRDYCERAYLDEFDAFVGSCAQQPGNVKAFEDGATEVGPSFERVVTPGHHDVYERLRQLDRDGVAGEVVFHGSQNGQPIPFLPSVASFTSSPLGQGARAEELGRAGIRIYNRWLADFCSVEPHRHVGLAQLPIWDLDRSIDEIAWARAAGLRGVNFPAPRPSLPDHNDPVWDPFWSACEASDMPLNTHGGSEMVTAGIANYSGIGGRRLTAYETHKFSSRGLWWMILGGVFERHPKLKLILTEQIGVGAWLPLTMTELDELDGLVYLGPSELSKSPSEYFRSNCYIGASFMSYIDAHSAVDNGFDRNYLWGSDFPHREGTYPWSILSLRMSLEDIPPDAIRRLVGQNLIDVFGLDRPALQTVADRIGPTMHDLTTPLPTSEIPHEPGITEFSFAFRRGFAW